MPPIPLAASIAPRLGVPAAKLPPLRFGHGVDLNLRSRLNDPRRQLRGRHSKTLRDETVLNVLDYLSRRR